MEPYQHELDATSNLMIWSLSDTVSQAVCGFYTAYYTRCHSVPPHPTLPNNDTPISIFQLCLDLKPKHDV